MVIVADTMEVKGLEGEVIGPIVGKLLHGGEEELTSSPASVNEWERRIVDQFTLLKLFLRVRMINIIIHLYNLILNFRFLFYPTLRIKSLQMFPLWTLAMTGVISSYALDVDICCDHTIGLDTFLPVRH